ncbi:TraX family protein [Niallia circulans]|uniref:TraX family protein n=1 Tax=Niallia circulans TaxID=1397 RepID=UPI00397D7A47
MFLVYEKRGGSLYPFSRFLLPFADSQWMMISALPLLYFYNGKRGVRLKYFFYFFYPIHIIILYFIGTD